MEERLISQEYPLIQVDSHGKYDSEQAENSWLQFAPRKSDDGRLTAERFQGLRLGGCGTLILGACSPV